jgi:hypothetical protein
MLSSRLNRLHRVNSHPPNCHPEHSEGSAYLSPSLTVASSHSSHSLPVFSIAALACAHSNVRNPNPLMRLLHDSLDTRGGGPYPTTRHTFAPSHDGISSTSRCLAMRSEQRPTAISFSICTYTNRTRIPFGTLHLRAVLARRIRTYKKPGGRPRLGSLLSPSLVFPSLIVC